jgi:RNA polymerase sigma factor (sigma-70 family)
MRPNRAHQTYLCDCGLKNIGVASYQARLRDLMPDNFERELVALIPRLRRFARSLVRDAHMADDLCQMAIEKALKSRGNKRPEGRLDGWMFMILRNQWLDELRRARRQEGNNVPIDATDIGNDALAAPANDPLAALSVHRALTELPLDQREAAALVWVEGYSYLEAAEMLAIPIGTLTSRLSRARGRVLSQLEVS